MARKARSDGSFSWFMEFDRFRVASASAINRRRTGPHPKYGDKTLRHARAGRLLWPGAGRDWRSLPPAPSREPGSNRHGSTPRGLGPGVRPDSITLTGFPDRPRAWPGGRSVLVAEEEPDEQGPDNRYGTMKGCASPKHQGRCPERPRGPRRPRTVACDAITELCLSGQKVNDREDPHARLIACEQFHRHLAGVPHIHSPGADGGEP